MILNYIDFFFWGNHNPDTESWPLDMNDDILITIDRIIMYHISNKMTQCQLNSTKDCMSIVLFVYRWQDIIDGLS